MALAQVLEEIQSSSRAQVRKLEEEAREARAKAVAQAQAAVEEYRKKALEKATRDIVRIQAQEAASTELELKREELQMERELLDRVLKHAEERLMSLPRERNEAILKGLLSHYGREGTQVLTTPKDELYVKMASGLHHAGKLNGLGGLVIMNADGTVRMDLAYETLMRDLAEKKLKEIHGRLLGGAQ